MIPVVRAAADRLVWEGALLAFIGEMLPEKVQGRRIDATGRTVRQAYDDLLASDLEHNAVLAESLGRSVAPLPGGSASLAEVLQSLAAARSERYQLFEAINEVDATSTPIAGVRPLEAIRERSGAYAECAYGLVEALPEIAAEPLVVNWLALVDVERDGRAHLAARKAAYIARVREQIQGDEGR